MSEVTRILSAIEARDPRAAEQLLPLVYDELRQLAAQRLAGEKPGQTLQPTALVHEAYLRLVGGGPRFAARPGPATLPARPGRWRSGWATGTSGSARPARSVTDPNTACAGRLRGATTVGPSGSRRRRLAPRRLEGAAPHVLQPAHEVPVRQDPDILRADHLRADVRCDRLGHAVPVPDVPPAGHAVGPDGN